MEKSLDEAEELEMETDLRRGHANLSVWCADLNGKDEVLSSKY